MITVQSQDCRGKWNDVPDEYFESHIARCQQYNGMDESGRVVPVNPNCNPDGYRNLTREEVVAALESGQTLRNHNEDWYSVSRMKPAPKPAPAEIEYVMCDCGHECPKIQRMSASMGSSCPDCYDRMS